MNKLFSKIATLSVGLAMAIGVGVAIGSKEAKVARAETTVTFTAGTDTGATSVTKSGVTVSMSTMSRTDNYRTYANTSMTVSSSDNITEIKLTCTGSGTSDYGPGKFSGNGYSYSGTTGTWSGSSNSVSLAASAQVRMTKIEVKFESADILQSITVSGAMSKTSYTTAESWSAAGLVATGHYQTAGNKDITDKVEWSFNPTNPAVSVTSVVATATLGTISGNSAAQTVSVTKANPLQLLYTKSSGASIEATGYFVGKSAADGAYIMDGEYGFLIGDRNLDCSSYVEGETVLHATGSLYISAGQYKFDYSGLTVTKVTDAETIASIAKPVIYSVTGTETQEYESRLTTVTGTVKSITPKTSTLENYEWDQSEDVTIVMTVGGSDLQVFLKRLNQSTTLGAALESALSSQEKITVKAYTAWYNAFQVSMVGIIEAKQDYTAEEFAQDLLDQTDNACSEYPGSDNDPSYNYSAYKTALEAIWSDLASDDKYPSLPQAQKDILAEASREGTSVISRAMKRYDFLTGKYDLSNFIVGRTPIVPANGRFAVSDLTADNNTMIIVIAIAATSALAFTMLLVFKKKKQK